MSLNKHFLFFAVILIAGFGCDGESSGTSGTAGTGGMAGSGAEAGAGGEAGVGGMAGSGGEAGAGGLAGAGGVAGIGGMAGAGGEAGTGGMAGAGGEAGTGGMAGSGGEAGAGGEAGTGGMAGSGGEAGAGGEAGVDALPDHSGELMDLGSVGFVSMLATSEQYTRFSAMLAQLTGEQWASIQNAGPVTVFAPSDDAFEQLDEEMLADVESLSGEALFKFVGRHLVIGLWTELQDGQRLPNLNSQFLEVGHGNTGLLLVAGFDVSTNAEVGRAIDGYIYGLAGVIVDDSEGVSGGNCSMPSIVPDGNVYYGRLDDQNGAFLRYEPGASGIYCIDTKGSAFDTTLDVFEACDLPSSLLEHGEDVVIQRDGQNYVPRGFDRARVEIELQVDESVDIRVLRVSDGEGFAPGDFALTIRQGACPPVSLYDVIQSSGQASFFLDALWYAAPETLVRLMNRARSDNDYLTAFVPPDSTFRFMAEEDASALVDLWSDRDGLADLLNYHIIEGAVSTQNFAGLSETLEGASLDLTNSGNRAFANDEPIIDANQQASNGVIHELQGLLYLPSTCMTDMMCEDGEECIQGGCRTRAPETIWSRIERLEKFSLFKELVLGADNGLDEFLDLPSPFFTLFPDTRNDECDARPKLCGITAFLPTNDAFADVSIEALLTDEEIGYRLDHHVLAGFWYNEDLNVMSGLTLSSIMNRPMEFSWDIVGFLIEGEPPIARDVFATNGLVHEIESFLEFPAVPGPCDLPGEVEIDGATVSGTTAGLINTQTSFCGGGGSELAYEIRSTAYQRVCVTVQATEDASDPLLYIREASCDVPMNEVACLDDNDYPIDVGANLDVEMAAGEAYFAFVDALFDEGNGGFEIRARTGSCAAPPTENLYEVLSSRTEYSKFASLLSETSYVDTLSAMSIHSVFIPTNLSLETLETETPDLWAALTSAETIDAFVGAHLAAERHALFRLSGANTLTMLNSQQFEIFDSGSGVTLGGITIIESEPGELPAVETTNGLIYTLGGVLMPELTCGDGCPDGLVCGDDLLCTTPPPVGSCENPSVIVPFLTGQLSGYSGDTSINISNTSGSCGESNSPDYVFSISISEFDCIGQDGSCPICISTAPATCGLNGNPLFPFLNGPCSAFQADPVDSPWPINSGFNDVGTTFDTILRVHEQSCLGTEVVCEGQTYDGIRGSAVTVDMTPNQNYFVVVDGLSAGLFGEFNLAVRAGPCP